MSSDRKLIDACEVLAVELCTARTDLNRRVDAGYSDDVGRSKLSHRAYLMARAEDALAELVLLGIECSECFGTLNDHDERCPATRRRTEVRP